MESKTSEAEEHTVAMAKHLLAIKLPETRPVNFEACFGKAVAEPESVALVSNANACRASMVERLTSSPPDYRAVVGACEQYLPHVVRLFDSLNASPPVRLASRLQFHWSSPLSVFEKNLNAYEELIFDIAMTMVAKAFAHLNIAIELSTATAPNFPGAGAELRHAAGLMKHLNESLLPRWLSGTSDRLGRPPEVFPAMCGVLHHYFVGAAQQMAICQALTHGSAPGLLSELCRGVCVCIERAEGMFRNDAAAYVPRVVHTMATHFRLIREVFYGLAYRFMAQATAAKHDTGIAMGLIDKALNVHLCIRPGVGVDTGLPELKQEPLASLLPHVRPVQDRCRALRASFDHDNRLIYFQAVPPEEDLPELREGRVMMKPTDFTLPTGPAIRFVTEEEMREQAKERSIFRMFRRSNRDLGQESKESSSEEASRPVFKKSDSDLARELQAKLNAGEDV